MKAAAAGLALAALLVAAPALADTPEEAVAYAFLGLADGGKLVRATTTMQWTESAKAPATFESAATVKGHPANIKFTVRSIDSCDYEITLQGPQPMVPGGTRLFAKVDLKKVTDIAIGSDGFHLAVSGDGYCETGRTNMDCLKMDEHDLFGPVEAARHKAALTFLRTEVCAAKTQ